MTINDAVAAAHANLQTDLRKLLAKNPMSEPELADALNVAPKVIKAALREMQDRGLNLTKLAHGRYLLHNIVEPGGRLVLHPKDRGDGWTVFGFITDNHKCNRHHRQDVENAAYATFAAEGITEVLNAGNWIDGEARFNQHELTIWGVDRQCDEFAGTTPQHKGITTYFISGDDHEGWYTQKFLINIGRHAQDRAEKLGREDLKYIGHVEADVELRCGKGSATLRLMHPGGGSAYALSYAPQKLVESFQGGEKPPVLLIGHYHKWDYCYPREVHVVSGGCVEDQSMFMRKNKIAAHVGFSIIKLKQDPKDGHITRFQVEWNPWYDRKFYEKRYC